MARVASEAKNVAVEFEEFAQDAEHEIFVIGSIRDAFEFPERRSVNPAEWIVAALA
jgi:hypothetical protein